MSRDDPIEPRERRAHTARVDPRAEVGSSSTRPGARNDTRISDGRLDERALDGILDELLGDAVRHLRDVGFDVERVELAMRVGYLP